MAKTAVYVSNAESTEIRVFELNVESGGLSSIQQLKLDVPGPVMPMAVSPDRRFLYAAQRGEPFSVLSFAIDGLTGELTQLGSAPLLNSMPYIVVDRTGRWLLSASYQGDVIGVSPIGREGFVQPVHQAIRTEPRPHSVQVDAANRYAYVPCLGGDIVRQFRFDEATGRLEDNTPAAVRVGRGAGPRHFAFHPNNRTFYLLNELEASVYVFDYEAASGLLCERQATSALPPDFDGPPQADPGPANAKGGPKAADIHVSPDGRFLYASERTTSTLAAFKINLESGHLVPIESISTEQHPRGFNINPTGRFLLAVGERSHHMTVHGIDQETGSLTVAGRYEMGKGPNWVEIIRLA